MAISIIRQSDPHDPHASRQPLSPSEARDFARELSKRIAATESRAEKVGFLSQFQRRCIAHRSALSKDKQCKALMEAYARYEVGKL
jgi:hypothetical protein